MRMISHDPAPHNATGVFLPGRGLILRPIILYFLLLMASGCGEKNQDKSGATEKAAAPPATSCQATLDLSGWEAFTSLGDQLMTGQIPAAGELESFGNLPAISMWRESMTESVPSAAKVGNFVEQAFWDQVGKGRPEKMSPDRNSYGRALRFSYDHRTEINELLERFRTEDHTCRIYALASRWLEPKNLPDPLKIIFVASKPELRSHQGSLVADTGVLLAGGLDQTDRQLVALLYRDRQALKGDNPLEVEGAASVAHTLRIMMNEGVAARLDDLANTHFNAIYPKLGKVSFIPEDLFETGIRAMDIFNTNLPRLLADPASMQDKGMLLAKAIVGAGALTEGGYCMAVVIADRLGEDRLLQARTSPPAFLEAYQEAAKLNPLPLPTPGTVGSQLFECMPAFSDEVYPGLLQVLEEYFPRS